MAACLLTTGWVFGQPVPSEVESRREKLADLMARISIHEAQVTHLLSKIQSLEQTLTCRLPLRGLLLLLLLCLLLLRLFLLRLFRSLKLLTCKRLNLTTNPRLMKQSKKSLLRLLDDLVTDPNQVAASGSDGNTSADGEEDLDDAYAKLYESGVPSRHKGYYFGPLFGLIYPQPTLLLEPLIL